MALSTQLRHTNENPEGFKAMLEGRKRAYLPQANKFQNSRKIYFIAAYWRVSMRKCLLNVSNRQNDGQF